MTPDLLLALAGFALATSITPGPNNLMLLASGANFGFRRTIPHMLGIGIGFTLMIAVVGLGMMALFERAPQVLSALKAACLVYLAYLAWKLATAAPAGETRTPGRPLSFLQAAAFQWVNPKAWAMATTAISLYAPDRSLPAVLIVALIFGAINLPSVSTWTLAGRHIRRWLAAGSRLRAFNLVMAALLVVSVLPML